MKWTCLQHVPFEGPGYLEYWAKANGHRLQRVELWTGAGLPRVDDSDGFFVLGGPMNVYEDDRYSWLVPEKKLIEAAILAGTPVLGICLGAQLISVVLGGTVTRNAWQEIGWFPVRRTEAGQRAPAFRDFPEQFMAFHWHGDRSSIPAGAIHLARSDACEEQAFVYEQHVVGLQFHLEATEESIGALIRNCRNDITCSRYTQDPASMEDGISHLAATHRLLDRLLDGLSVIDGPRGRS